MNPIVKNILAVLAGFIIGGLVNMGTIMLGSSIIPPPAGVDPNDLESIKASLHLFEAKHYITPFLAHAFAALVGAFVAAYIAATRKMTFAMLVGVLTLAGGIAAAFMIPAPTWFIVLDLVVAYIPMAWLGGKFALSKT